MKINTHLRIVAAFLLCVTSGLASAQTVNNPSFETLGQVGWTSAIAGGGAWNDLAATPPATNGVNGVLSNQGAPASQFLYQDVTLPATGQYAFRVDAGCNFVAGGNSTDFCRVDLTDTSAASIAFTTPSTTISSGATGGVLFPVFVADNAANAAHTVAQAGRTVIFNGTAGQVIRIRFLVQASNAPTNIFLDNVILKAAPQVPTLSEWSLIILAVLLVAVAGFQLRRSPRRTIA